MSEEEIIKIDFIKKQYEKLEKINEEGIVKIKKKINKCYCSEQKELLTGFNRLYELYKQEKEKNKEEIQKAFEAGQTSIIKNYISKDKIREIFDKLLNKLEEAKLDGFYDEVVDIKEELLKE